ncbi:hypothetical protein QEN19_002991 [Hanseniaspora menglaensis]
MEKLDQLAPPTSINMRRGHKHKRSFALSGDNFEFLQPNNNTSHNGSNSTSSLQEILQTNKEKAMSSSNGSKTSLSTTSIHDKPIVIDFENAEKLMLSKNNKTSSLRHKRSESAPSELNFEAKISTGKSLSYDNWLDVANTTMEDQINDSWEHEYKNDDEFTNKNNKGGFSKKKSIRKGSTDLLIEEDENESGSENNSPLKAKNLDSLTSKGVSTNKITSKYRVSTRNFSDNSYRSITPSSANSNTSSSYRTTGKTQRERYSNFGIPYSPQGSRTSSNGSHMSTNNSSENGASSLIDVMPTLNANEITSGNLSLRKSTSNLRLNGYVTGSKLNPRHNNKNGSKSPFNFKPQEYDISKDLEELKDIAADESIYNADDMFTTDDTKKTSISTILGPIHTTTTNNYYQNLTPKHKSNNQSISAHSRQLTDTDSTFTLLVSSSVNNNKHHSHSVGSFNEGICLIEEPEREDSIFIEKSQSSTNENQDIGQGLQTLELRTEPELINTDIFESCNLNNNTVKNIKSTTKSKRKVSIPSSISMSNISINSFSIGDKRQGAGSGESYTGLKKSLSIQSLSKYLGKSDKDSLSEEKSTNPRRKSFMSRLFSRK